MRLITTLYRQSMGYEPEPLWMSALGAIAVVFVLPFVVTLLCFTFGGK